MSGFGVKIARGTVTHWQDRPLDTYEQARECRDAIRNHTGEEGEIVEVLLSLSLPAVPVSAAADPEDDGRDRTDYEAFGG